MRADPAAVPEGSLILDEVDLILHPLKSELNWPMGKKEALDFTRSRAGDGLRWQIPFFMLDAMFCAAAAAGGGKALPAVKYDESREALNVLEDLRKKFKEGLEQKVLQRVPHLVLADDDFYHSVQARARALDAAVARLQEDRQIGRDAMLEYLSLTAARSRASWVRSTTASATSRSR